MQNNSATPIPSSVNGAVALLGRLLFVLIFLRAAPKHFMSETIAFVWNKRSLRRTLQDYFAYYQRSRAHLSLGKDAPEPRAVEPPEQGCVVAIPQVGGLHHRYQRRAA
jgi:hypothetical protein